MSETPLGQDCQSTSKMARTWQNKAVRLHPRSCLSFRLALSVCGLQSQMLSFLAKKVPRTTTCRLNPIFFDDGRSYIEFKSPNDQYLVMNRWPPGSNETNKNIALRPPLHWHRNQTETFHVISGSAKFIYEGQEIIKTSDQTMLIPMKTFHTFCNASAENELVIEFVLEPKWKERDEAFFRRCTVIHSSTRYRAYLTRKCAILS